MVDRLMLMQAIATAAALTLSAGSSAQTLVDPTRPPLELIAAAAGAGKGAAAGAATRPRLESILLSSTRKGAIINGQYVPLGGSLRQGDSGRHHGDRDHFGNRSKSWKCYSYILRWRRLPPRPAPEENLRKW